MPPTPELVSEVPEPVSEGVDRKTNHQKWSDHGSCGHEHENGGAERPSFFVQAALLSFCFECKRGMFLLQANGRIIFCFEIGSSVEYCYDEVAYYDHYFN